MKSILTSIKKMLGITEEYTYFDADIMVHINTVLAILRQMGVGPTAGFYITGSEETWDDFVEAGPLQNLVKSYMFMKVRMLFDPPQTSAVTEASNNAISELEWRINTSVDPSDTYEDDE